MSMNMIKTRPLSVSTLRSLQKCCYATKSNDILSDINVEEVPTYTVEPKYTENDIDNIRNKSRLAPQHRNILHNKAPYTEPYDTYHNQVWYRKRVLGRYGINTPMANPKYCWPTKEEVDDIKEYESVLYPKTIQEVWKDIEEKKKQDALELLEREKAIDKVAANFEKWKNALETKMQKKEAELLAAKQRKEAMLEEVRDHFGFQIDVKDERFQEMLAQKEKEDKKKKKEEKKLKKREKMMAFMAKHTESTSTKKAEEAKVETKTSDKVTEEAKLETKTSDKVTEEAKTSDKVIEQAKKEAEGSNKKIENTKKEAKVSDEKIEKVKKEAKPSDKVIVKAKKEEKSTDDKSEKTD